LGQQYRRTDGAPALELAVCLGSIAQRDTLADMCLDFTTAQAGEQIRAARRQVFSALDVVRCGSTCR
jgi:hypothetical protein